MDKGRGASRPVMEFRVLVWVLAAGVALAGVGRGVLFLPPLLPSRRADRGQGAGRSELSARPSGSIWRGCRRAVWVGSGGKAPAIAELMRAGRLVIYPADRRTISLVVSGSNREDVFRTADDLAAGYVAYTAGGAKAADPREAALSRYKQLGREHERLKLAIHNAMQGLPPEKIDTVLEKVAQKIQNRIKESEGLVDRLDRTNKEIAALREELLHPTLKLDPRRWDQIRSADRPYSGDLNVLKGKHADYLAVLRTDMKGLTAAASGNCKTCSRPSRRGSANRCRCSCRRTCRTIFWK